MRIPADHPAAVQAVPASLRRLLDGCQQCPSPDRCDVHTPDTATTVMGYNPGRLVCGYKCHNGHRWERGYAWSGPAPALPVNTSPDEGPQP